MNRLVSVIGPAPSELSWDTLRQKLRLERERVRKGFDWWKSSIGQKATRKSGRKKGLTLKDIKLVAQSAGMTVEEMQQLLTEEVKKKEN